MAARRKAPAEAPAGARDIPEILDRILKGESVSASDLRLAAGAAAAVRRNWLKDFSEAIGFLDGSNPAYEAFKNCTQSMLTLFVQHGLVSAAEAQQIWVEVEARG